MHKYDIALGIAKLNLIESGAATFEQYKAQLMGNCRSLSPMYQPINSRYYQCYFSDQSEDRSFCIELGKRALLLVLVSSEQQGQLSYFHLPVKFVWCEDLADKERKGVNKVALKYMAKLAPGACVLYYESSSERLSEFALSLLKSGYGVTTQFNQQVDLRQSEEALFSDIRKIFRANIRWGQNNLTFKLLTADSIETGDIEVFRQLHIKVSGYESRSVETWRLQEQMIIAQEAFGLYGYLNGELVSTGLFPYSQSDCYYGVGAYDRSLFDKPISHALVWRAMQEAKKLGCLRFFFGETFYPALLQKNGNPPSDKELAISHFKQGFGGVMMPELVFKRSPVLVG
jgi:hypothetical protein